MVDASSIGGSDISADSYLHFLALPVNSQHYFLQRSHQGFWSSCISGSCQGEILASLHRKILKFDSHNEVEHISYPARIGN